MSGKNPFAGRVYGRSILLRCTIFIAVLVLINLIIHMLPVRFTRLDMSRDKLYTLSEHTLSVLADLDQEISIYLICTQGNEDQTFDNLVRQFVGNCRALSYEHLDPAANSAFIEKYATSSLRDNSCLVISGERSCIFRYDDIYPADYENYFQTGQYTTQFCGERCLISAICSVTQLSSVKLYALSGHGESTPGELWNSAFESQGIVLEELNLLTHAAIPSDCSCLLIFSPLSDLSSSEIEAISHYMQNGGNLLLVSGYTEPEAENLHSFMFNEYGISSSDGIVLEGDSDYCLTGYNFNLIPEICRHDITVPMLTSGYPVVVPAAQGLTISDTPKEKVYPRSLLSTSEKSYIKNPYTMTTLSYEHGDDRGSFSIAVAVNDIRFDSRAVWISSDSILDKEAVGWSNGGNEDFIINCLNWLCRNESAISTHSKSVSSQSLIIPSSEAALLSIALIVCIPASFFITGLISYLRRNRR